MKLSLSSNISYKQLEQPKWYEGFCAAVDTPGSSLTPRAIECFNTESVVFTKHERRLWEEAHAYPSRPVNKPAIDNNIMSLGELEKWAVSVNLSLGPLLPDEARQEVLSLFYHYRHLDCKDLSDLPFTDLITHRISVPDGTKPCSMSQKRWPPHTEWWMRELVLQGLRGGV